MFGGGVDIAVRFEPRDYLRSVDKFIRAELPFAKALALTRMARAAASDVSHELRDTHGWSSKWVTNAVAWRGARKGPSPTAEVSVGARKANGAEKRIPRGSEAGAAPYLRLPRSFKAQMPRSGKYGVFQRRTLKRLPIQLIYTIQRRYRGPKGFSLPDVVERSVSARFPGIMTRALNEATQGRFAAEHAKAMRRALK